MMFKNKIATVAELCALVKGETHSYNGRVRARAIKEKDKALKRVDKLLRDAAYQGKTTVDVIFCAGHNWGDFYSDVRDMACELFIAEFQREGMTAELWLTVYGGNRVVVKWEC